MTEVNLFETASREKYRFVSGLGDLTVEQLWDLPLKKAGTRNDLDSVARTINAELKAQTEESFVDVKPSTATKRLANQLELVKRIISVKQEEEKLRVEAKAKAALKQKILAALEEKDDSEFKNKSREELLAQLETL